MVFVIFLFYFSLRLYPYFKFHIPLGYDAGIYLYSFKTKFYFPPFLPFFAKTISNISHINLETLIWPLLFLASALLFYSIYLFTQNRFNRKVALWAIFILTVSCLQYRVFYWYYLKNIFALSFLFFALYCLDRKSIFAYLWGILVVLTHSPTDFVYFGILLFSLITNKKQFKFYLSNFIFVFTIYLIYYLPIFSVSLLPLLRGIFKSLIPLSLGGSMGTPSGTFYEPLQALVLSILYFPLAIVYFIKSKRSNLKPIYLILLIIAVFRLFFYRRLLIYLDIFSIIFAANILANLKNNFIKTTYVLLSLVLIIFFVRTTAYPQINHDEFREINSLDETIPEISKIMVTDQAYMPWLYGYTRHTIISPGYGENDLYWTTAQWQQFWTGDLATEIELLKKVPSPIYIFHSERQPSFPFVTDNKCFEKVSWRVYKFICN